MLRLALLCRACCTGDTVCCPGDKCLTFEITCLLITQFWNVVMKNCASVVMQFWNAISKLWAQFVNWCANFQYTFSLFSTWSWGFLNKRVHDTAAIVKLVSVHSLVNLRSSNRLSDVRLPSITCWLALQWCMSSKLYMHYVHCKIQVVQELES